ncbi:6788_t:CDS:1 [Paraglomus occultum]|uniref:6788_t:CDS:1 n=1 Tax=Paraglomus occultum TaxID=144539 RepID=A0A9N9FNA4_9GLOM|nr:6788_t:CDS:1 [Paraglomus occultum]
MSQKNFVLIFSFLALLLPLTLVAHPVERDVGDSALALFSPILGAVQFYESTTGVRLTGQWNNGFDDIDWTHYTLQIVDTVTHALVTDLTSNIRALKVPILNGGTAGWTFEVPGVNFRTKWNGQTLVVKHSGVQIGTALIQGVI